MVVVAIVAVIEGKICGMKGKYIIYFFLKKNNGPKKEKKGSYQKRGTKKFEYLSLETNLNSKI